MLPLGQPSTLRLKHTKEWIEPKHEAMVEEAIRRAATSDADTALNTDGRRSR